jgi:hypothetical protein
MSKDLTAYQKILLKAFIKAGYDLGSDLPNRDLVIEAEKYFITEQELKEKINEELELNEYASNFFDYDKYIETLINEKKEYIKFVLPDETKYIKTKIINKIKNKIEKKYSSLFDKKKFDSILKNKEYVKLKTLLGIITYTLNGFKYEVNDIDNKINSMYPDEATEHLLNILKKYSKIRIEIE